MAWTVTIGGVDCSANVEREGFRVTPRVWGGADTFNCRVRDYSAVYNFALEADVIVLDSGVRVFGGKLKQRRRIDTGISSQRLWDLSCAGWYVLLDDDMVDPNIVRGVNETDKARITSFFSSYGTKGITVGAEVVASYTFPAAPAIDYGGQSLREMLDSIVGYSGATYYVDPDKKLHYFTGNEALTAPWGLSDSPNGTTLFPYSNLVLADDSTDIKTRVYVVGTGIVQIVDATGAIATYGMKKGIVRDPSITNGTQATTIGNAYLLANSAARTPATLTCERTGLRPGQAVAVTHSGWGLAGQTFRIAEMGISVASPTRLQYDVSFGRPPDLSDMVRGIAGASADAYAVAAQADADAEAARQAALAADAAADAAQAAADAADAQADAAAAAASNAQNTANSASGTANTANNTANSANSTAQTAQQRVATLETNVANGSAIGFNVITETKISSDAITTPKIAANQVIAAKLGSGTLTTMSIEIYSGYGSNAVVIRDGGYNAVGVLDTYGCNFNNGEFDSIYFPNGGSMMGEGSGGSSKVYHNAYFYAANGVGTRVVGGAFNNVPPNYDGQLGVDNSNGRFYFFYNGGWHYVTRTAGFEIPEYERECPACGQEIVIGDNVVGRIAEPTPDGALHGLYIHADCAATAFRPAVVKKHLDRAKRGARPEDGPPVPDPTPPAHLPPHAGQQMAAPTERPSREERAEDAIARSNAKEAEQEARAAEREAAAAAREAG